MRLPCLLIIVLLAQLGMAQNRNTRPNILFCISDDQSFPHTSAYGTTWVRTPGFDRVAEDGILFWRAYTPNAKCAPSRSIILTGRNSWQLEEAANHVPFFPEKFVTFAETLRENGYRTGYTGKGWAPGNPGMKEGKQRELIGKAYLEHTKTAPARFISTLDYSDNFEAFLDDHDGDAPFFFWYGGLEPHRPYEFQTGFKNADKSIDQIDRVFQFWPDNDTVRTDMLDYAYEIEYFDQHLVRMLQLLEDRGELDNTIVVVTSDNGMPFPRVKGQTYEASHHMPLAIMWKKGIVNPGRDYDAYVSFTDLAPTFLEVAGISETEHKMQPMEGRSLVPVFNDQNDLHQRTYMVIGKERHDLGRPDDVGYPVRGIFKDDFLYLINFKPDRWPSGNPETGYMNTDGSPTKTFILNEKRAHGSSRYWDWSFGLKSGEELYNLAEDPDAVINLLEETEGDYKTVRNALRVILENELRSEGDPRILGQGDVFDKYPYAQDNRNFYNRFMGGEDVRAGWINQSDIEKKK